MSMIRFTHPIAGPDHSGRPQTRSGRARTHSGPAFMLSGRPRNLSGRTLALTAFVTILFSAALLTSCSTPTDQVNVYSGRHYQSDETLFRQFTEQTGIRVNLIKADTDQLINRMQLEGASSPADLLITADAGRLVSAAANGLLQPVASDLVRETVPAAFRDPVGYWTGLTKRARVIVYHKDRVDPSELSTYEDLAGPAWQGRVLVRSSQNHYNQTLMASIVAALGPEQAETWARGLVANMARSPQGNDRDQVKAMAAGLGDVAIVNTYYMGLLLNSSNEEERQVAAQAGIFFPNQQGRGTHVNISGIGIAAHAPNKENARQLIEFLLGDEAQRVLSSDNYEYPVSQRVEWPELLQSWGTFREDTIPLSRLEPWLQEAMFIFNRSGWK
jgi:iron(III) transport system substrate-binding protein